MKRKSRKVAARINETGKSTKCKPSLVRLHNYSKQLLSVRPRYSVDLISTFCEITCVLPFLLSGYMQRHIFLYLRKTCAGLRHRVQVTKHELRLAIRLTHKKIAQCRYGTFLIHRTHGEKLILWWEESRFGTLLHHRTHDEKLQTAFRQIKEFLPPLAVVALVLPPLTVLEVRCCCCGEWKIAASADSDDSWCAPG